MSEMQHAPLMRAIAVMTDWRLVQTFKCEALWREVGSGNEQLFKLHAEPIHSSYSFVEPATGKQWSYDDRTRVSVLDGRPFEHRPENVLTDPFAVRLAFPLSLPIWGRRHDTYRMVDAHQDGSALIVQLAGRTVQGLEGTVTIDVERGMAVRIDASTLRLEYRGIERARSLFGAQFT